MLIYLAGPLFCEAERVFNERLTDSLEALGFQVFLPQRDGPEKDADFATLSLEERQATIFTADRDAVLAADVFLFVLDGRVPDEGAAVELGIAYQQKVSSRPDKRLIGLMTDDRAAFAGEKLNPMIALALDEVVESEALLLAALRDHAGFGDELGA